MSRATLRIRFEAWARRSGLGATIQNFGLGLDIHRNDIGLSLSVWYPWPRVSLQLGPISLWVGFDRWLDRFVGLGASYVRSKNSPAIAFWLTEGLRYEWWPFGQRGPIL